MISESPFGFHDFLLTVRGSLRYNILHQWRTRRRGIEIGQAIVMVQRIELGACCSILVWAEHGVCLKSGFALPIVSRSGRLRCMKNLGLVGADMVGQASRLSNDRQDAGPTCPDWGGHPAPRGIRALQGMIGRRREWCHDSGPPPTFETESLQCPRLPDRAPEGMV